MLSIALVFKHTHLDTQSAKRHEQRGARSQETIDHNEIIINTPFHTGMGEGAEKHIKHKASPRLQHCPMSQSPLSLLILHRSDSALSYGGNGIGVDSKRRGKSGEMRRCAVVPPCLLQFEKLNGCCVVFVA